MTRAYYHASITDFLRSSVSEIVGELTRNHPQELLQQQTQTWIYQIQHLSSFLMETDSGHIFFEFQIPRVGKRADAILLLDAAIFVLEYKRGAKKYERADINQVMDYALDLKNFHGGSHHVPIVPILVATAAPTKSISAQEHSDGVFEPLLANEASLPSVIRDLRNNITSKPLDAVAWMMSPYQPTPTIIEAAQSLYENHSVAEISRSDAAGENLTTTATKVDQVIRESELELSKSICFVTGVPGAGKTLAGLNIATARQHAAATSGAVFLSGNDPLVSVLREALARNVKQMKGTSISDARRETSAFIQNIRHFRDETHSSNKPPHEHVVVFDEAQRAWHREKLSDFMKRKRNDPDFHQSEPEFLLSVMDRHDWCAVVCLVGGGQEINKGESGIGEWLRALRDKFPNWRVFYSDQMTGSEYDWDGDLQHMLDSVKGETRSGLHLSVALRSFRAERLSLFMSCIVAGNAEEASALKHHIRNYAVHVTRDLKKAQQWVQTQARGSERYGMLASAGAARLRPEGVVVKIKAEPEQWFLNDRDDVRSSFYLEDVATEFDVQGLELDWTIVCWDANFRREGSSWAPYNFSGTKWDRVHSSDKQRYTANSYRVLLTRARQGTVIYVPKGETNDPTRNPAWYDSIYDFLRSCGIPEATAQ